MNSVLFRLPLFLLWLSIVMLAQLTPAQTPVGSIDVYATDTNGQVVPGAVVTCENQDTGYSEHCNTDSVGYCRVKNLPSGSYKVTVDATGSGFERAIIPGVIVNVANEKQLLVTLRPGGVATSAVTIAGSTQSLVETQSTALVTSITAKQLMELPLPGRNPFSLLLLAPGVSADTTTAPTTGGISISANGARARSNSFTLDGLDVGDSYRNQLPADEPGSVQGPTRVLPTEAIAELRISMNSAESGRNSGSTINVVSQSGTNTIHGSIFEFFSSDALKARDTFNSSGPKNKLRANDFGFSLGGPVKRDKVFFFTTYEGQRNNQEITAVSSVPTDEDFRTAIIALGGSPAIPIDQNPVVNGVIRNLFSLCRLSARCPGGVDLWPKATIGRELQVLNSLDRVPTTSKSDTFVVRGDSNIKAGSRLSGYFSAGNGRRSSPITLAGGDDLPNTNTRILTRSRIVSVSYFFALTAKKLIDLHVGWNRYTQRSLDEDLVKIGNPSQSIGLETGITNPRDFGLPHLVVRNFASPGASPYSNPKGRTSINWQMAGSLVWVAGNHDLKIGYDFRHPKIDSFNDVNFRGELKFASLADFLAGKVQGGSISSGNSERTAGQNFHALYLHDAFRLSPYLTLDLGARWDYFGVLHEANMSLSKYDPSRGLVIPRNLYNRDLNNFSPRAGFAWDITRRAKTVLRAGGGIYFDAFSQDLFFGQVQFNTFNAGPPYNAISERPILASRSPVVTIQAGQPVFPVSTFMSDTRDAWTVSGLSTPYALDYNLNLQQELLANAVLQIAYVGSSGRKLFRTRDVNARLVPGGSRPFDNAAVLSSVAPNRPFVVNQIETSATSSYNALQVSLNQRLWRHLTNIIQWTWSHSIDDASDGIEFVPNRASPDNPHVPGRERANSSFDTRHSFSWGLSYDLPTSVGGIQVGNGWQIGSILTIHSGQPYNVNFGDEFDSRGAYDFILRPDVVGDPLFGTSQPDRLLNLAAFQVPCTLDGNGTDVSNCLPGTLHFGNLPRNAFVGPDFRNFDFSISKTTDLRGEPLKLQFRAEFFNLTNHPNFFSPLVPRFVARASLKGIDMNGRGGARGTGCNTAAASNDCYLPSTRTSAPRSIQLSIRFLF